MKLMIYPNLLRYTWVLDTTAYGGTPPFTTAFDFLVTGGSPANTTNLATELFANEWTATDGPHEFLSAATGTIHAQWWDADLVMNEAFEGGVNYGIGGGPPDLVGASWRVVYGSALGAGQRRSAQYLPFLPGAYHLANGLIVAPYLAEMRNAMQSFYTSFISDLQLLPDPLFVDPIRIHKIKETGEPQPRVITGLNVASSVSFLRRRYR